jgi:hypothetical protein
MRFLTIALWCLVVSSVTAQQKFTIRIEPSSITNAPAIHSGAFGEYDKKWFFIGGRKNGLHGFLPPSAFTETGVADTIYIVNPSTNQRWSADVYSLPDSIREAITSSNMEFYLNDSMLYMIGGYGFNAAIQDFITYHTLTAVNIKQLMTDVINGQPINGNFRQIKDSVLAVCGAHLAKLDSTYYLVFGHRYDGYYDRIGTLGIATQTYTNEIRKFKINDNGTDISIDNYVAIRDTDNFHRRDYNLVPMMDPYKGKGFLAYSGVFQKQANLPYLNCVEIYPDTFFVRNDFNQNLSQYHSAVAPLYDSISFLQHHLFFGGMSMYYIDSSSGQQTMDTLVPFVNTISDVARDIDRTFYEIDAGIKMPGLMGTNAYFFMDDSVAVYADHFVHLNKTSKSQRIGYIVGGINSMEPNISENNPNANSFASSQVYEVWIDTAGFSTGMKMIENKVLNFIAYPNPSREKVSIEFELPNDAIVKISMVSLDGKILSTVCNREFVKGKQRLEVKTADLPSGTFGFVIQSNGQDKFIRLVKH